MNELEEAGWSKTPDKPKEELTNKVFNFFTPDLFFLCHLNHFEGHQEDFQSGGQRPQWRGFKIRKLDWLLLIFFDKQILKGSEITSLRCRLL